MANAFKMIAEFGYLSSMLFKKHVSQQDFGISY